MYIYELPYEINKELCRLLDHNEDWKELAGVHMKYSAFDVNEIEQESRRQNNSPSNQLFIKWGQLNHRVEELFILLHRMRHVLAMRCLLPIVDARFHKLLKKQDISNGSKEKDDTATVDENTNRQKQPKIDGSDLLPLPVILMERGVQPTSSDKIYNGNATTDESSTENSSKGTNDEFMCQMPAIPMIKYDELKEATDNWSESNLLGRGGFGQVFQGKWKLLSVAIKRLRDFDGINKELIGEMCLNQYRHDNILPLYGYSHGGPEACLVYQLMAGGSLEQRLKRKTQHPPLTWSQRYRIAHGVASGLQYLHNMSGTPLIHGDIKPANILLDQCTMPKIGDFGLARRGPYGENRTHLKVSRVHGTRPYLPEEYLRSHCLSPGVDVFSYGVVLLEIASALPAIDRNRTPQLLSDFIHKLREDRGDFALLEDKILQLIRNSNPGLCRRFIEIGVHCTNLSRHQRPTMLQVYQILDSMQFPGKTIDNYMA